MKDCRRHPPCTSQQADEAGGELPARTCIDRNEQSFNIANKALCFELLALKPGGLLCLQVRDRDCAAGFLDRRRPRLSRRLIWRTRQPGAPGPHPAVYEPLTSVRGVHAYARLRGLVIAERHARGGRAGQGRGTSRSYLAVQTLVARLSRGRLTDAHEEMLYVIRKPEDRFARLI